jgi:hypothetical protein
MNKLILLSFGVLTICAGAEEVAMTSNSSQMNSNGKMNSTPRRNLTLLR